MRHVRIFHLVSNCVLLSLVFYLISNHVYSKKNELEQRRIEVFEYYQVDQLPIYLGSVASFDMKLKDCIEWPEVWHGEGYVLLSFIISIDGNIMHIRVERGLCDQCDINAVAALSKLNHWEPGLKNEEPVATRMFVRVEFAIK
jgi:hypothetical protein